MTFISVLDCANSEVLAQPFFLERRPMEFIGALLLEKKVSAILDRKLDVPDSKIEDVVAARGQL